MHRRKLLLLFLMICLLLLFVTLLFSCFYFIVIYLFVICCFVILLSVVRLPFFISHIGVTTSCSWSCFRNLGQLAACIIGSRLGGDLVMFKTCGDKNIETECDKLSDTCNWVMAVDTNVIAIFGQQACMPSALVRDDAHLLTALESFFVLVESPFPRNYANIVLCVGQASETCVGNACVQCLIPADEYPNRLRKSQLRNLCLPRSLHNEFCEDIQTSVTKTLCQKETERVAQDQNTARGMISSTGCDADCAYAST